MSANSKSGGKGAEGKDKPMSREERLAAQLRENLRRRKAQSRAMKDDGEG
ncbi:hypothetical protein [Alterisphingorhabdus coralli]|uniref:Uncharacterized protein n=1 Tax=Alterisphingorhabdus coralli TaxID=3071408 RepID=A0AA97F7D4_9SPHN|nr:hypothetical protein [Parasphingorhabdus sp. SCSIO 66989]WOE75286.1 hypothetical protein RB602_00785 [Parasphingorhabdus sp. SCSIO 66989]